MAEEVIRVQEGTQTPSESVKTAEQMGTVIAMESVKLAAENQLRQGEARAAEAEPERVVNRQIQEEVQKPAAEAARAQLIRSLAALMALMLAPRT